MRRSRALFLAAAAALLADRAPAQSQGTGQSSIIGIVSDSVSGRGLADAEVVVSGISNPVLTDSSGGFSIVGITPGTYQIGVFHPLLESLGVTLATAPFTVGADSAAVVNLAVPSVPTLIRRYCGATPTPGGPAVIAGRVLEPDTDVPVPGAKVSVAWVDMIVSKETGVVRSPHVLHADTDGSGFFRICGVPNSLSGATLQATRAGVSTPEVPVDIENSLLFYQSLAIASPDTSARTVGMVSGRVQGTDGRPISGARVDAPAAGVSVVAKEDGAFTLRGVATGTQLVVARQLGFDAVRTSINVLSREPAFVTFTLDRVLNVMDPVLILGRANYELERNGFNARKKTRNGHYFSREDIEKRQPHHISQMLRNLAGVRVLTSRDGAQVRRTNRGVTSLSGISGSTGPLGQDGARGSFSGSAGACPALYVDGFKWRNPMAGDLDSFINPADVIGLEVYPARSAPPRFRDPFDNGCVTIVVWTQIRPKKK